MKRVASEAVGDVATARVSVAEGRAAIAAAGRPTATTVVSGVIGVGVALVVGTVLLWATVAGAGAGSVSAVVGADGGASANEGPARGSAAGTAVTGVTASVGVELS